MTDQNLAAQNPSIIPEGKIQELTSTLEAKPKRKYNYTKKAGRPAKYKSADEMAQRIDRYFSKCPDNRIIYVMGAKIKMPCPTISGLALYLGFADRHQMYMYELKPEFSHTIKKARAMMERTYEQMLHTASPTGAIFALKNFGWSDKQEIEHTGNVTLSYGHRNGHGTETTDTSAIRN